MRDAARYEDLAAFARAVGYVKVTSSAVQGWVKAGLLPRATWHAWAFGRRSAVYPVQTGRQLLELCRLRYHARIRQLPLLAVTLWGDGWVVPSASVRIGLELLARSPERFLTMSRLEGGDVWDVANVAVFERGFRFPHQAPDAPVANLAEGLGDFVAAMGGTITAEAMSDEGLIAVAAGLGLDRAARDHLPGGEPWLPDPPADALRDATRAMATASLLNTLAQTTDESLEEARSHARVFSAVLLAAVDGWTKDGRPQFGGFGAMAPVLRDPLGLALVVLAVLAAPDGARSFIDELDRQGAFELEAEKDQRSPHRLAIIR